TDLVRRSQVDRESAHHRNSIHLTGAQALKHRAVVFEKYIPYLQAHLRKAVEQKDPIKIQVYVKALANTGHPNIWVGLEQYLEGKYPVSDFQRLVMIAYLGKMVKVHPNTARSILFKIYKNEGDVPA
ncbi:hypothetical protein L9G16_18665, partial [Shewanella sp. A25]|nr:hypothetical protein [Shewanella shenzhenensis]